MLVRKLRQHQLPEHRQEAQLIATSQTDAMHLKHVKRNTLEASRHEALCVYPRIVQGVESEATTLARPVRR